MLEPRQGLKLIANIHAVAAWRALCDCGYFYRPWGMTTFLETSLPDLSSAAARSTRPNGLREMAGSTHVNATVVCLQVSHLH